MDSAFVSGPSVTSRTAFTGASVAKCAKTVSTAPTMSASPMSRRQAMAAGVAFLAGVPFAALAKSGDSPTISIFGVGGQSSPFDAGVQRGGVVLYKTLEDAELSVFRRIISESKDRIVGAQDSIKTKSWEDIRSRIRLEAQDFRKVQNSLNDALADPEIQKKAKKATNSIKLDLEQLDQACVQKNQDVAFKKYNNVVKDIDAWLDIIGLLS